MNAFSSDTIKLIMLKLYVAKPDKPQQESKLYNVEDLLSCLKSIIMKQRQNCPFQNIDDSMTKFNGRYTSKQYLPMKAVKRGMKLERDETLSGYKHDVNVYASKDDKGRNRPLDEKAVKTLLTIPDGEDALDSFFTSVHRMYINATSLWDCSQNQNTSSSF
uniref:uncharacterized protein LOC120347427 n=1 Tax=Styela clava TaxID=7725 RepID=UPI00193A9E83|nr:uncharacterized protein LOC120347427 [Styela clava]